MDEFDAKILNIVQRDNRLPAAKIAEQVGLSPSAVQRRLNRLRKEGVIEADVAIVSPDSVGRHITAIVGVVMDKDRPMQRALSEFRKLMLNRREVIRCYDVTGEEDFIVIVSARDMKDYEAVSRELFMENPNIRRYKSSIVIRMVKSGTAIPADEK
ncbi:MAG: Lrp/AsnC family transcriptional regulator [Acidobacteriota bacterium]|nr:MAG: Lrp/AsnC family transcriptional regulator [Acidobacteriota bacterium]